VYHSISSTHWWWCESFNFINTLISVCWWNWMTHTTISVLMKLNDTHHHQWVNEIEWYTPPSVCWWNWMTHTTISVLMKFIDGGVYHSISPRDWWWCVSFNFINTLMVECVIQFYQHWRWSVSFNFINMKLNDIHNNQCVIEIEWHTPPSVS
jgi:hypothetical protein